MSSSIMSLTGPRRITIFSGSEGEVDRESLYDIVISDSFDLLPEELERAVPGVTRCCIVTDNIVEAYYADAIYSILSGAGRQVYIFSFMAGEENKQLSSVAGLYSFLIENGFDRKDCLIALGGGVVGDMTGFAAATYLRGIRFVQIPTTLLAQCDSSIGGKTGVDLDGYKNMIGAFHMPSLVYMNMTTLHTLEDRQFTAGMGEVIKHGLIKDAEYFRWIIQYASKIVIRDVNTLSEMIYRSCCIKAAVVQEDPKETGIRGILNYGHTLGHAIEKYSGFTLLHGECVAIGSVASAFIAYKRGMLPLEDYHGMADILAAFGLPVTVSGVDPNEVIYYTKSDKKMVAGHIKYILLEEIGKAGIYTDVTDWEMQDALRAVIV